MNAKHLMCASLCACLLFTACGSRQSYLEVAQASPAPLSDASASNVPTALETTSPTPISSIIIHVSGAVVRPGVYELPLGSRIYEAIDAAGGILPDADSSVLNLASPISDGMKISVPLEGENTSASSNIVIGSSSVASGSSAFGAIVNINTADATTLTSIPGIGPSKAAAIVKYREENGPFKSISDLTNVSGIGEATVKRIQNLVVL